MNQPLSMDQVFLSKITAIIESNLENEKFGAGELSHELGMSRSNINRRLKAIYKNSISQLIQEIRLQRAMEMLQQKVATAAEVAFRVGFSSPSYFNKCFHEYYGFPPGEVKKLEAYDREKARQTIGAESPANGFEIHPAGKVQVQRKNRVTRILVFGLSVILVLFLLFYFLNKDLFRHSGIALGILTENSGKSIAVLPFVNLSNDPEQEYFSDGMMEEILSHLFMIGGLRIPSSASTMLFKGSKLPVREIARELGVSYILVGNVSRTGNDVRIIVRLVDGKNEQLLWTEEYNRAMTAIGLHEIQSEVAQEVAEKMNVVINPEVKKRMETAPTENTEAYLLFLQASQYTIDFESARQMLERAVSLDPGFADAYALMAYWRMWTEEDSLSREQMVEKVESLLNKALQLDKNSVMAHGANADFRLWFYWDFETVEKEYQIFRKISPSNTEGSFPFVQYLWVVGRFRDAYILCKDAFEQNKLSAEAWIFMAISYDNYGKQKVALETIETALRVFPHVSFVENNALDIFISSTRYEEAIALFEKIAAGKELHVLEDRLLGAAGIAYLKTGNKGKTKVMLNELLSRKNNFFRNQSSYYAASLYLAMGEKDKALSALEYAYATRELVMADLKIDPNFRPLHGEPRFEDLLAKIGFK
jgi:TolB-like protein/AraC-like DNA-binding protein